MVVDSVGPAPHPVARRQRTRLRRLSAPVREALWSSLGFFPTEVQRAILDDDHLEKLVMGGIRGGKSFVAAAEAVELTLSFIAEYPEEAGGHVAWLVGADYERTRPEFSAPEGSIYVWLKQHLGTDVNAGRSLRVDPGEIRIATDSGRPFVIKTKSASDENSLGMEAPIFIIACEAAHLTQNAFFRLHARVSEARARFPGYGLLLLEGTLERAGGTQGLDPWYSAYWKRWGTPDVQERENARSFSLPTHSNTFLYPGGENDPEIQFLKATTPEDVYAERHLGIPVPPAGRVFPFFNPAVHVREVQYDPAEPVYLGIDPGYSGRSSSYVVLAAHKKEIGEQKQVQWQFFDEIAINKLLPQWANFRVEDIIELAMQRPWWANETKIGVIDVAGASHPNATESNEETWRRVSGVNMLHERVDLYRGTDRMKSLLHVNGITGEPGMVIGLDCKLLGSEFGAWPNPHDGLVHVYRYPQDGQGNILSGKPRDEWNDGIKAATYLVTKVMGYIDGGRRKIGVRRRGDRRKTVITV